MVQDYAYVFNDCPEVPRSCCQYFFLLFLFLFFFMGHVFVSFHHCSIIFTWANIQHFTLQIYHMAVMFFVCMCVLKPLFFLWLKAIIQLLPLDFALE